MLEFKKCHLKIDPTRGALQDACDLGDMCAIRKLGMDCAINFMVFRQIHGARNCSAGSVTNTRNLTSLMSSNSFYDFNVSGECDELILEFFKIN
jgi:hypothetical protein